MLEADALSESWLPGIYASRPHQRMHHILTLVYLACSPPSGPQQESLCSAIHSSCDYDGLRRLLGEPKNRHPTLTISLSIQILHVTCDRLVFFGQNWLSQQQAVDGS
jgi:hypothetical protein